MGGSGSNSNHSDLGYGDREHERARARLGRAQAAVAAAQRHLLDVLLDCAQSEVWRSDGCADLAHWVSVHLGISEWMARRWVGAALALRNLPHIARALETGVLPLDKVIELSRFATPATDAALVPWAATATTPAIRRRADREKRGPLDEVVALERTRHLSFFWMRDGETEVLDLYGRFPADQGAVLAKAIDRLARRLPDVAERDEDDSELGDNDVTLDERRADALVALASRAIASDQDPDRATIVVHAPVEALAGDAPGCEIEHGPVIHPETMRRLACDARLQVVSHGADGVVVGVGRSARIAPPWLVRQLRHRDGGCTFPGCGRRWFLHAHHIVHWGRGGPTDLGNLVLTCTWHHKLLHEHGWSVALGPGERALWRTPGGRSFEPFLVRAGPDVMPRGA